MRTGKFRRLAKALGQTPDAISGAPSNGGRLGNVPADRVSISDLARQRSQADELDAKPQGTESHGNESELGPQLAAAAALLAKRQIIAGGASAVASHLGHSPGAALRLLT